MKKKLLILGLVLLITINIAVLATIGYRWQCQKGGKPCEGYKPGEYLCQKLSLSNSQKEKMEILRKTFEEKTTQIRETLSVKRNELVKLLSQPEPDNNKIESLIKEIGSAQTELEKEVINHILKEKEILTREQQEKFLKLIGERLLHQSKCERNVFSP